MNRREVLAWLAGGMTVAAHPVARSASVPRMGYLALPPIAEVPSGDRLAFLEGLRELGYVDGQTLRIVYRSGEMNREILQFAAQDLVDAKVDVIAAAGTVAAMAAREATRTTPIVMIFSSEPVVAGLVSSLARPGGNVTGVSTMQTEIDPKRLAIFSELVPGLKRVAVLWTRFHPSHAAELTAVGKTAGSLGLTLEPHDVTSDLFGALKKLSDERPDGIFVLWDVRTLAFRQYIADFALKHRLPTSTPLEPFVDAGGLMSYGPNVRTIFRRSASYVHRILRGARPTDLPVERPAKFDLVINMRTAQALGLKVPAATQLLADRVIE